MRATKIVISAFWGSPVRHNKGMSVESVCSVDMMISGWSDNKPVYHTPYTGMHVKVLGCIFVAKIAATVRVPVCTYI